jgi:hypothetical protein
MGSPDLAAKKASAEWSDVGPKGLRLGGETPQKGDVVLVVEEHEDVRYYFPVLMLSGIEYPESWFRGELLEEGLKTPRIGMLSSHQIVGIIREGDPLLQLARAYET